jgi:copper chaperone
MNTTTSYLVSGMTCGHCVSAVTKEISSLPGVLGVDVELDPEGTSKLRITGSAVPTEEQVAQALDEAGDYRLISAGSRES